MTWYEWLALAVGLYAVIGYVVAAAVIVSGQWADKNLALAIPYNLAEMVRDLFSYAGFLLALLWPAVVLVALYNLALLNRDLLWLVPLGRKMLKAKQATWAERDRRDRND